MTRRFQLLSLCVFVCLVAGTLAFAQAPPLADVLTYSPTPNQNYGTYTSLFVQKGGGAISASYIKFNIATLPPGATVTKATLRLFVNQVSAPGNFDAYQLNSSWTESGLTYSNAPALGTSATGNHPVSFSNASVNQFILLDVTSLVEAWANGSLPNNGLALAMTTASGAVALDSKESIYTSHQPELEIVLGGTQGPPGPQGPEGPQGPQGQQGSAGSNGQGFTFRAAFNNGTSYNPYDVVTYNGSTYDASVAIPPGSGTPDQNPHWTLMAQEGAQGQQGSQGQPGPQGQSGATGPQGPQGLQGEPGNLNPGSPYYIQNGTILQTGASFNIDGTGTVGGTLTGTAAVNTSGPYQIGGIPVLNTPIVSDTFVGAFAGGANTTGSNNALFGNSAGNANTSGSNNTFLGTQSGQSNTTGSKNTFVGGTAGQQSVSGANNTFLGYGAGNNLSTGGNNLFVGINAGATPNNAKSDVYIMNAGVNAEDNTIRIGTEGTGNGQQNQTFIAGINSQSISAGNPVWIDANGMLGVGSGSSGGVTSFNTRTGAVVPANGDYSFSLLSGTLASNQLTGTYSNGLSLTNTGNLISGAFTGNGAGLTNVPVTAGSAFYIQNGTAQQASSNFNISGNGTVGGNVNAGGVYQIGGGTVLQSANDGTDNVFVGQSSGPSSINGNRDTFLGALTGNANTIGAQNTFVGFTSGKSNTFGMGNTYLGSNAGGVNNGSDNVFVGLGAGNVATTTSNSILVGFNAGLTVTTGSSDILIGNTGATAAESNTIRIGTQGTGTGQQNTVYVAGITSQTIPSGNPVYVDANGMLGVGSGGSSGGVTSFNTRTGAVVPANGDYSFSLLSGTLADGQLSGSYSTALTFSNGSDLFNGSFTGNGAGLTNVPVSAGSPNYVQNGTAQQTGASFNIDGSGTAGGTLTATAAVNTNGTYQIGGTNALLATGDGSQNTFVGIDAGAQASGGRNNTFVGSVAGGLATSGSNNNSFFGDQAGENLVTGARNTFLGSGAGAAATTGTGNTFLGNASGSNASTNNSDIYIANSGSSAESNTIRIGTDGTGSGQQNTTYIAGINEQTINSGNPVWIDSNGKLGIGSGSSGGVTSFNTRTGAVVPAGNDYSFSLLSGTLADGQLSGSYSSALTFSNGSDLFNGSFTGNGAGLTNVPVSAGSPNYLQNGTSQQTGTSFNIDGSGTVGTTFSAGSYQIAGSTVVSTSGTQNLFVGALAGQSDTGQSNTFLGYAAGSNTVSGNNNIFVGPIAGQNNQTGSSDVYVGNAGPATGAENNTVRIGTQGTGAGQQSTVYIAGVNSNTIPSGNPVYVDANGMLGIGSGGSGGGVTSFNTRTGAVVPAANDYTFSLLGGTLADAQLSGSYSSALTFSNGSDLFSGSFTGNGAGLINVPVSAGSPNYIQNGTSQQTGASFNVDGSASVGTNYQISGTSVLSAPGTNNLFVGPNAGLPSTSSTSSTFVGSSAGQAQTSGNDNTYIGSQAGYKTTTGLQNTMVGAGSGMNNTTGSHNTLLGSFTGNVLTGDDNTLIGDSAGIDLANGIGNTFLGFGAGQFATSSLYSIFIGYGTGNSAISGGGDIYINNSGASESNTIRIGTQGSNPTQQNRAFIAGISGSTVTAGLPVFIDSAGQLGTGGGSGVVTSFNGRAGAVTPAVGDYGTFYIQNSTSQQASSNFNISGSGTAGGTLTASTLTGTSVINSLGTYQINNSNILRASNDAVALGIDTGILNNQNTFVGAFTGEGNTTGDGNAYFGYDVGHLATGSQNTLVGSAAGASLTIGTYNTFLGESAGSSAQTGSDDIYIMNAGVTFENNTIRIGTQGTGDGQQNTTYIAGIRGTTASGGINVLIDANGKLGTTTSSRRFKDNILDMGEASSKLFQLRPVTFFYKPQYDDGSHILQYGLIAEEVAKIYPDLVVYGEDGQPQTIRYHLLTPMLLNELQKQHTVATAQQDVIQTQQQKIELLQQSKAAQQQQIEDLQQRLSRVESLLAQISETSQRK